VLRTIISYRDTVSNLDEECKVILDAGTTGGNREQWFLTEQDIKSTLRDFKKSEVHIMHLIAKQFQVWYFTL
jgi:hypothetical protein